MGKKVLILSGSPRKKGNSAALCAAFARGAEEKGLIPVINAALLESMGFVEDCDLIILAVAPYEVREARAMKRDGMTKERKATASSCLRQVA